MPHLSLQWSDRELGEQSSSRGGGNTITRLKTTIMSLIGDCAGVRAGSPMKVFGLCQPKRDTEIIILVGGIRADLAGDTLVLDSPVIPVSENNRLDFLKLLDRVGGQDAFHMRRLFIEPQEILLWKQRILPMFIERSRTWSHTANCEYALRGNAPHSLEADESRTCTCGRGIGFTGSQWPPLWKELLPHATRATISPIFPVPYLELVAGPAINRQPDLPLSNPAITCWECGNVGGTLMACGKCKTARYCSAECQKKNWKKHKPTCKTP